MIAAIDLGAAYARAAVADRLGNVVLCPDRRLASEFSTPALVHVHPMGAFVGHIVQDLLADDPVLIHARRFKSRLGSQEPVLFDHDGRPWGAEPLTGLMIGKVLRDVRATTGESPKSILLTVPASFNDAQRRALLRAARLADIEVVDLIEEPLSAAMFASLSITRRPLTCMIVDLGGDKLDVAVVRLEQSGLVALSSDGASNLGGFAFDEAIAGLLAGQWRLAFDQDPRESPAQAIELHRSAERIKRQLASPHCACVRTLLVLGSRVLEIVVTRSQFEAASAHLTHRIADVCERTVRAPGLDWKDIDRVIVCGGGFQLPFLEVVLRQGSGLERDRFQRPRQAHVVVSGAALMAASRGGARISRLPGAAKRVAGFDLGFRTMEAGSRKAALDCVIPRNSALPAKACRTYYSQRPDQRRIIFEVVQAHGDEGGTASLGRFEFPLVQPRKNHPVEVTLEYSEQGMVSVVARDPNTGEIIRRSFSDDELGQVVQGDQHAWVRSLELIS